MLELFLGQIPEAIFFSLFMIYTKRLKEKRILFTVLMTIEYLLLKAFIHYNIWFQILYTTIVYFILKSLYEEKAQITDIFTFTIGSIILTLSCIILYFIVYTITKSYICFVIVNRIFIFVFIFLLKNKLYKIEKIYKKLWNRNDIVKKKIKTTTFRAINVVMFNGIFYALNIIMLYAIYYNNLKGGV